MLRFNTGLRCLILLAALTVFLQGPAALIASEYNIDPGEEALISNPLNGGPLIKSGRGTLREPLDSGCFFKSHYQRAKNRNLNRALCLNGWITTFECQFFGE
jgi:hypothetical protein